MANVVGSLLGTHLALKHGAGFVRGVFIFVVRRSSSRRATTPSCAERASAPDNVRMDDIVRQAMAKWPNVPHCYGWLGLDERGNWYMRDDRVQAAGPFPQAKGSLLRHEKLIDFIHRNYERDEQGQWFFQNGPQRVYVELQATPWIWRVGPAGQVSTHTGAPAQVQACFVDEDGPPLPGDRPRLRAGAHPGHRAGVRRWWRPAPGRPGTCARRSCPPASATCPAPRRCTRRHLPEPHEDR